MMVRERFDSKFIPEPTTGCWLWTAAVTSQCYGRFSVGRKTLRAHRVAYELYIGIIPDGLHVLHKCDQPPCVNPEHLFLGTHADNTADMCAKGRQARVRGDTNGTRLHPERVVRGESHHSAKLTEEQVRAIRAAEGLSHQCLADAYGVSRPHISYIRSSKKWAHIQ